MSATMSHRLPRFTGAGAFYALAGGQFVSTIGSGMTRFALGLWVLDQTGDVAAYTTLLFAAVLPIGAASLFVGPFVDRWNRRRTLILANAGASASTLVVALLYMTDTLAVWHLYVALSANGIASAFILPALEASTPMLVEPDRLGNASGVTAMLQSVDVILAPVLAVPVYLTLGLGFVFAVDFATFAVSIAALLPSRVPQPARVLEKAGASIWSEFRFGLSYIVGRRQFIYLISFMMVSMLLIAGFGYALATPLALSFSNEAGAAVMMTSYGVGSFVSGALLAAWGGPKRRVNGMLGAMAFAGFGAIAVGLRESLLLISAGTFMIGFGLGLTIGLNRAIWQAKAAPDVLGRVFSLRVMLGIGATSLGILTAGPLAEHAFGPLMEPGGSLAGSIGSFIGVGAERGMALMYVISGATLVLLAVVSLVIRPIWRLEDALPDQEAQPATEAAPVPQPQQSGN